MKESYKFEVFSCKEMRFRCWGIAGHMQGPPEATDWSSGTPNPFKLKTEN